MALMVDNQGNSNYSRVVCMLIQEGTSRIRHAVVNNLPKGQSFKGALSDNREKFQQLRKKNILTSAQYSLIYPSDDNGFHLSRIDMSLLILLARNITDGCRKFNWNKKPEQTDRQWQHDVIRIRDARNDLFHMNKPEIEEENFHHHWEYLACVLRRLGTPDDVILDHLSRNLDPDQSKECSLQVRQQCLEELRGVYLAHFQQKRHSKIIIGTLLALFVLVTAALVAGVVLFVVHHPACASSIHTLHDSKNRTVSLIYRRGWRASPPRWYRRRPTLTLPAANVIFGSTFYSDPICSTSTNDCCVDLKKYQEYFQNEQKEDDINFHYLVGGNGMLYEGRPSTTQANIYNDARWENSSIYIGFIGLFDRAFPTVDALNSVEILMYNISKGARNVLMPKFNLYAACQVSIKADNPGRCLQSWMPHLPNWNQSVNGSCDWEAKIMEPPFSFNGCVYPCY